MKKTEVFWSCSPEELFVLLGTSLNGLSTEAAATRLAALQSKLLHTGAPGGLLLFFRQFKNPLVLLLVFAVILSYGTGTYVDGSIIFCILFLSGLLGFIQEHRANKAAEKLHALIQTRARVKRDGTLIEIPLGQVVPGDLILLEAGDIVPADALIVESKDLYVNESALTGESFPSEKKPGELPESTPLIRRINSVFQGTSVISGSALVLAATAPDESELGKIESEIGRIDEETAFEKGIKKFGYLLMRVALLMSGIILITNLALGRPALDSVLFALALSVGITPELLPAIITITLSAGSKRLASKKVIVKKLSSIQNLGAVDVLCSDKTGTLTEGEVSVHACVDAANKESPAVRQFAYLNAVFETGYSNPMDQAIVQQLAQDTSGFSKFDEVPYDFIRKRLSIVVAHEGKHTMITKGALKNILDVCSAAVIGPIVPIEECRAAIMSLFENYSKRGFRVIGLCTKDVTDDPVITKEDETGMMFLGFILLQDPPKAGVAEVIARLKEKQVALKVITGDNTLIALNMASQIGIPSERVLSGEELQRLSDEALIARVSNVDVFAETEPSQKERIVRALQHKGHVVGYVGDGINDASALKVADVGISVNNAADVAKESADVILLEKNLDVISDGIMEGRKTYMNTTKYILISVCSNFGNMFSLAVLSLVYPYLPLLPAQILLINFLTDLPAIALVSDAVDPEFMVKPRRWDIRLIRNFMVVFGLESSFFDFLTFFVLSWLLHLEVDQTRTGWFVESVISEVLILLVIRTHRTFLTSHPGRALIAASLTVIAVVLALPYTGAATIVGLKAPPVAITGYMLLIALLYAWTAEITKKVLFKKMNY